MKKIFKTRYVLLAATLAFGSVAGVACGEGETKAVEYAISVSATEGGSISASAEKVQQGESVVFNVSPDEGYVLAELLVNGNEVEVVDNAFTVKTVLRDYTVEAKFATPDVTIEFEANGGSEVADEMRLYGDDFGALPVSFKTGMRFNGWKIDGKGAYVKEFDTVDEYGTISLVADWTAISTEEKEALAPFSSTCVYHDMAATKYGVVWHTYTAPVYSAIQIVEGNTQDFSKARTIAADVSEPWLTEYISNGVIDNLKFSTEYSVRFGDLAADVWSEVYHFTTREEKIDVTKFFYVADTQETYLIDAHPASSYIGDTYFSYVVKDMVERFPEADFIAHGGDIVNWGAEPLGWKEILQSLKGNLFQYPMQTIAGNHEDAMWYSSGQVTTYKMFNIDYPEPDKQNPLGGGYFSYDYGPVHFTNLVTNDAFYTNGGYIGENQLAWIERDFAAARANPEIKWIIVTMHEGIYSISATKAGSNYHRTQFASQLNPLFDEYDVELVMYGHDHWLECTYPLVVDETQTEVVNLVSGVRPVTNETKKVTLENGEVIEEFVYPTGTTDKGTVHFEVAPAGHQYGNTWTVKMDYTLEAWETLKGEHPRFRMVTSGLNPFGDKAKTTVSMYSYIEVSEDELLLRTYGVPVLNRQTNAEAPTKLIDGFRLTK